MTLGPISKRILPAQALRLFFPPDGILGLTFLRLSSYNALLHSDLDNDILAFYNDIMIERGTK